MIVGSVARRYAKALLSIGVEQNAADAYGRELEQLARAFETSPDLRAALANPVFPHDRRKAILDEIARRLGLSKTVHTFVLLLLDKHEDPTMLGGIITQLGDTLYDGSVRNQLAELRARLLSE